MNAPLSLSQLQQQGTALAPQQNYAPGFASANSFELMIRQSKLLMATTLVPAAYRAEIVKYDKYGNVKEVKENPNALANCAVALNMATRMGADPLMVMQNLYIVEGRPSWSSQWIISAINGCGRFSPLRFEIKALGKKKIPYVSTFWVDGNRQTKTDMVDIDDKQCVAWVKELATGERLESPPITIEMAVREGWYTKNGSKWQTMDEVMLRYRAASFFGKLYAPELLMGLQTREEVEDFIDMEPVGQAAATVNVESLRKTPMAEEVSPANGKTDPETGEIKAEAKTNAIVADDAHAFDVVAFGEKLEACTDVDTLDLLADEIRNVEAGMAAELTKIYKDRRAQLTTTGTDTASTGAASTASASRRGRASSRSTSDAGDGRPNPPLE